MKTIDLDYIKQQKKRQKPITMLTCYDACFAKLLAHSPIELILIGDSLGMVIQGEEIKLN